MFDTGNPHICEMAPHIASNFLGDCIKLSPGGWGVGGRVCLPANRPVTPYLKTTPRANPLEGLTAFSKCATLNSVGWQVIFRAVPPQIFLRSPSSTFCKAPFSASESYFHTIILFSGWGLVLWKGYQPRFVPRKSSFFEELFKRFLPPEWIPWLMGRWRTQLTACRNVNCRTHEHWHLERILWPYVLARTDVQQIHDR